MEWSLYLDYIDNGIAGNRKIAKVLQAEDTTSTSLGVRYEPPVLRFDKHKKGENAKWKQRSRIYNKEPPVHKNKSETVLSEQTWHSSVAGAFTGPGREPHIEAINLISVTQHKL